MWERQESIEMLNLLVTNSAFLRRPLLVIYSVGFTGLIAICNYKQKFLYQEADSMDDKGMIVYAFHPST